VDKSLELCLKRVMMESDREQIKLLSQNYMSMISRWLLIIGGLNWGLVGIGMLIGKPLNLVDMLLGWSQPVEAIVYVLVGAAAVMALLKMAK